MVIEVEATWLSRLRQHALSFVICVTILVKTCSNKESYNQHTGFEEGLRDLRGVHGYTGFTYTIGVDA